MLAKTTVPATPSTIPRKPRTQAFEPRLAARVLARVRRGSLDRRLLAGEDPASSTLLAARAQALTSERSRLALARGLRAIALSAQEPRRRMRVRARSAAILANGPALLELAERLRGGEPLYARGIARVERLITDGNGPAFRGEAGELAGALELAGRELRGFSPATPAPHRAAHAHNRGPTWVGGSFILPNGSWYHGRRESS